MNFFLYNLFIHLYHLAIRISGLFNKKAKLWVRGRKDIFRRLKDEISPDQSVVWFHCASLGEFEQGRPVIEAFREYFPDKSILLTFFSPSGYEIRKNFPGADHIFYLPIDTRRNARRFIRIVKPELAVFVKYEYWFNYMRELRKNQIPQVFISAIFRPEQRFFSKWGRWQLKQLSQVSRFFVQNQTSAEILESAGIQQVTLSGDTRFDRVYSIAQQKKDFPLIRHFKGDSRLFLAGSTWPADEEILLELIRSDRDDLKFIIAPHEVHPERIQALMSKLPQNSVKYSEANERNLQDTKVLLINNIGILSHLYQYASLAYIGGGFGVGIHNILEAATFGNPVIFGPKYQKFREAVDLIESGGAFSISSKTGFLEIATVLLTDNLKLASASANAKEYVERMRGATKIIMEYLQQTLAE